MFSVQNFYSTEKIFDLHESLRYLNKNLKEKEKKSMKWWYLIIYEEEFEYSFKSQIETDQKTFFFSFYLLNRLNWEYGSWANQISYLFNDFVFRLIFHCSNDDQQLLNERKTKSYNRYLAVAVGLLAATTIILAVFLAVGKK